MPLKLLSYIAAFVLLFASFMFFSGSYRGFKNYAQDLEQINLTANTFKNLSLQVTNAAIAHPQLAKAHPASSYTQLFVADSQSVFSALNTLAANTKDPVSLTIVNRLNTLLLAEINWLLNSNVPDSITYRKAPTHIAALQQMTALMNDGITRTEVLKTQSRQALNAATSQLMLWMLVFTVIVAVILLYTIIQLGFVRKQSRSKEERFQALVENNEGIIILLDQDLKPIYRSPSAERVSGYTMSDRLENNFTDFIHPDDKKAFASAMQAVLSNPGKVVHLTFQLQHKQGHYITLASTFTNLLQQPNVAAIVVNMWDVTIQKATLENLAKSELRYRSLIDQAADAICVVDENLQFIEVNESACKMFGYAKEELLSLKLFHILFKEDLKTNAFKIAELQAAKVVSNERRLRRKDGSVIDAEVSGQVLADGRMLLFGRDITEKKKAAQALSLANQRLTFHLNNSPLGYIEWNKDFIIQKWSDKAGEIFGWKQEDVLNRHFSEFKLVHDEDAEMVAQKAAELIVGNVLNSVGTNRNYTKDGRTIICQWFNSVLKDDKGEVLSVFSLILNVTEATKAEELLAESEAKYRTLVDHMNEGLGMQDKEGNITFMNRRACEMLGYEVDELLGKHTTILFDEDNRQLLKQQMALRKKGIAESYEIEWLRKDGTNISTIINPHPLFNEKGELTGSIAVFTDISKRKLAEKQLAASEQKFRRIFESDLIGFVFYNNDGQITEANQKFFEMVGYTQQDLMEGKINWRNLTPAEYSQYDNKAIEQIKQNGSCLPFEKEYIRKDGSRFPIMIAAVAINTNHGMAYIVDVSERKKATQQLRENELQLSVIFNSVSDVIYMMDVEPDGRYKFSFVNSAFNVVTGLEPHQVLGKYVNEVIPSPSLELVLGKYGEAISSRSRVEWEEVTPYPQGTKTGLVNITPIFNQQGQCIKMVGSVHDITERKKAEEAIKTSENYLRTIIETEPECIKVLNKDGTLQSMNPAGLAMIEADSFDMVKGQFVSSIVARQYKNDFITLTKSVFEGQSAELEFQIIGLKGTHRWLHTHAVPLRDIRGEITGLLSVTRDITARKLAEEKLQQSNQELRSLSSHLQNIREEERIRIARDIHDELGQQLTGIKMENFLLLKKLNLTDEVLVQKGNNIIQLIDDAVKSVRKISASLRPSLLDDLGLVAALEWHSEEVERRSGLRISFSAQLPEPSLPAENATALFRIYQEALTNVVRHAKANTVQSVLRRENGSILLEVTDDGVGMEETTQSPYEKTWGLIGIKERTSLLGGKFELQSAKGKGTKMLVSIPL